MDDSETFRNAAGPSEGPDSRKPEDAKTNDPCCHGPIDPEKRRNLVISIDGTSNKFGAMNTNVIEHHSLLIKDERQIPYYNSGIGTYARPSWTSPKFIGMVLHHKIDLAIAWDFDKTVKDAYRWISENYETGDLIFMFGFSRGAFQVRVLSAMIEKVGLLHKGNELQIPFAYELYSDPETDKLEPEDQQEFFMGRVTIAERFKRTFSRKGVKVHFVGVWDTVSSIGTVRGAKMLPGTIDGMKHVCFFRHALALDERRVKFLPEYANGGKGPNQEEMSGSIPHTKEVWFAGTHSDIGGGNAINRTLERTRPPLRWMVYEAGPLGLRTSPFERDLKDNEKVAVKESLTWVWWPFEYFPFRRLTYTRRGSDGKETTHSLHRGKVRKIQTGQKIHVSVISSNKYSPKASAPPLTPTQNGDFWGSLRTVGPGSQGKEREFYERWVELDLLDHIKIELESLLKQPGSTSESINKLLLRDEGQRAFYEAVLAKLDDESGQDRKNSLIKQSLGILDPTAFKLKMRRQKEVLSLLKIIGNPEIDYRVFLDRFSPLFLTYPKLNSTVFSVAFSPDGKWLASGLVDGSVLLWDTKSASQTGKALCGSSSCVASVAFSPDSKHLVSGLWDNTIRLWDVQKMEQVGDPWKGHSDCVCCVAFSPDGTKVVSASDDRTIKIWNPENGKEIAVLKGHEHYVHSVAFSPDGLHIVSGSLDQTVRIWDALKYQQVGEPLEGRSSWVWSVAYSPDNTHIASGSYDNTIRIWNAETGKQVGEPLKGHSSWVTSVCFSPDGKLLASGSADQTIQIWSTDTRVQIRELGGHDGWVPSVAFSPDGKTLASGSHDCTIRMWDIESYVKLYSLSTR